MTARLVLVRHGESVANVEQVLDTRPPGARLTEEGVRQASRLADTLAPEPLAAVYASRAVRARQTAAPVAQRHGLAVDVLDGVHESFAGAVEGRSDLEAHEVFRDVYRAWHTGDLDRCVPGGETGRQVLDRFLADLATVSKVHPTGTVVIVSHGAAMRLAAAALASNVDSAFADAHFMPNAGSVLLERSGNGWRCVRWNDVDLP
ncbi:MAG: histidine phosphatase family protein [Pseudonocardiaceae bacterium]